MSFALPSHDAPTIPRTRLTAGRAFANLFLFILALDSAQTIATLPLLRPPWAFVLLIAAHIPASRALFHLHRLPPSLSAPRPLLSLLVLASLFLSPFLPWWREYPAVPYFAINVALLLLLRAALFLQICRLVGHWARETAERDIRAESIIDAFLLLLLWSFITSLFYWIFLRAGLLNCEWQTLSRHLALMDIKSRLTLLLPDAAVLSLLLNARATAFRDRPPAA